MNDHMIDVLKQSQLLVLRLNNDLKILFANGSFAKIASAQKLEFAGRKVNEILPGLDLELLKEAISKNSHLQLKELPLSLIMQNDQDDIWVDVFFLPYLDVDKKGDEYLLLIVDVSDRLNARLQRDEFIAALAHDVKNPLVGEQRVLSSILSDDKSVLPPQYYDSLLSLRRSNQSLLLILSNLIDVYNLESGEREFVFENFDLIKIINEVIENFEHLLENAAITIVKHDFPEAFGVKLDLSAFVRVFSNILHNACKFAKRGSVVNLYWQSDSSKFQIEVESSGASIKKEDQPLLFKRFKRSQLGQEYSHSSGLGLYLCKKLIEGQKGSIECISSNDVTKLIVSLPLSSGDT